MFPSPRGRQGESFPFGGYWSPRGDMYLLGTILVERDADSLQRFVTALGAKFSVKVRSGLAASIAPQDPCFGFLQNKFRLFDNHRCLEKMRIRP